MRIDDVFKFKFELLKSYLNLTEKQTYMIDTWVKDNFEFLQMQKTVDRETINYVKGNESYFQYQDKQVAYKFGQELFDGKFMTKEVGPGPFRSERSTYGIMVFKGDK